MQFHQSPLRAIRKRHRLSGGYETTLVLRRRDAWYLSPSLVLYFPEQFGDPDRWVHTRTEGRALMLTARG
jgi:hypothetical protein